MRVRASVDASRDIVDMSRDSVKLGLEGNMLLKMYL